MSPKRIELLFSILIVLLLGWGLWEARTWPAHSRIFPWSIGLGVLMLALVQLIGSARGVIRARACAAGDIDGTTASNSDQPNQIASKDMSSADFASPDKFVRRRAIVMCSWILVFFMGIWLLGFRVGSFVLTLAFMKFGASENWRVSVVAGGISYLFFLLVFHFALQVPLAPGLLTEALGVDSLDDYLLHYVMHLFG